MTFLSYKNLLDDIVECYHANIRGNIVRQRFKNIKEIFISACIHGLHDTIIRILSICEIDQIGGLKYLVRGLMILCRNKCYLTVKRIIHLEIKHPYIPDVEIGDNEHGFFIYLLVYLFKYKYTGNNGIADLIWFAENFPNDIIANYKYIIREICYDMRCKKNHTYMARYRIILNICRDNISDIFRKTYRYINRRRGEIIHWLLQDIIHEKYIFSEILKNDVGKREILRRILAINNRKMLYYNTDNIDRYNSAIIDNGLYLLFMRHRHIAIAGAILL